MSKVLFITEKPSVATEFAKALKINGIKRMVILNLKMQLSLGA